MMPQEEAQGAALEGLPPGDVVAAIARSCSSVKVTLRLRASHPVLRAAVSHCISTLQTADLDLPPEAWLAFPRASGVRLRVHGGIPGGILERVVLGGLNSGMSLTAEGMVRCARVLRAAPQRVERMHLSGCDGMITLLPGPKIGSDSDEQKEEEEEDVDWEEQWQQQQEEEQQQQQQQEEEEEDVDWDEQRQLMCSNHLSLATALQQSPAAPGLTELVVDWEVLAHSCLDEVLRACPALERLSLGRVRWPTGTTFWSPAFPPGLTSLALRNAADHVDNDTPPPLHTYMVAVDTAAVTSLTNLQHLALAKIWPGSKTEGGQAPAGYSITMGALGSLTTLRSLTLDWHADAMLIGSTPSAGLTELELLVQLTTLGLNSFYLEPEAWATLARLPLLARLDARSITAPPLDTAAPLAALTSLTADLIIPSSTAPGALCTALPSLQLLDARSNVGLGLCPLAEPLRGHPQLRRLKLILGIIGMWEQQQPVLASMPELQHFTLDGKVENADVLLADLAACSSLCSIQLSDGYPIDSITGACVRALAGAASSSTLESIVLDTTGSRRYRKEGRVALADALPLLQARMPRLRELKVPVLKVRARELRAVARQLGRPVEVLRAQLALDS